MFLLLSIQIKYTNISKYYLHHYMYGKKTTILVMKIRAMQSMCAHFLEKK